MPQGNHLRQCLPQHEANCSRQIAGKMPRPGNVYLREWVLPFGKEKPGMRSPQMRYCWRCYYLIAAIFVVTFAIGCRKQANSPDANAAIQAALQAHVSHQGNLNLAAMDMTVENISVNGNRAQAHVQFRLRDNNVTMEMLYDLDEQGGSWIVTHSQPSGGQFSHPPMDQAHSVSPK